MALNMYPDSRTKQMLSTLLLVLIALNEISSSSAISPHSGDRNDDNVNRRVRDANKEFKTFSDATVKILRRHSGVAKDDITMSAEVSAFGNVFQLELKLNKYLVHPNYIEKSLTVSREVEYFDNAETTATDCYFIGHVLNQPGSAASATTCDGFSAQIAVEGNIYHVEPVRQELGLRSPHVVYRQKDSLLPKASCGADDGVEGHDISRVMQYLKDMRKIRQKRDTLNWPNDLHGKSKLVELYVANDYSQYLSQGSNVTQVFSRTKEIINFASSLYQPLDVYISLVGVEVWTTGSLITVSPSSSSSTLGNFTKYRVNSINPYHKNDNAQFISTVVYSGGVIGLSYVGTMCSPDWSAAIISDVSAVPGYTATVSAHEMGHNFGMKHDNQLAPINCACSDPTGTCVMNSYISNTPATMWSNCSASAMSSFLSSMSDFCLDDFNGVLFDPTPLCGNGIIESGEQCDCGMAPLSECNADCCNTTTCQLIGSAVCADGLCCDIPNCQLKNITTPCRPAASSCDVAEYCGGDTNLCPSDVYKHDGYNCTVAGVTSYCYSGLCKSRNTQCQLWYGPSTTESVSACYTSYNTQGKIYGNCGTINRTAGIFIACNSSDALCGMIKCNVNLTTTTILNIGSSSAYANLNGNNCKMPIAPANYMIPNLDMAPNGASCGANNMCVNQHCVSVASVLDQTACACSQHGVCNSLNQCHCDVGYGPPDCSQPGNGGSNHSNPITQ